MLRRLARRALPLVFRSTPALPAEFRALVRGAPTREADYVKDSKKSKVDDAEWFELQFNPELALAKYGIALPALPSDDVQVGFTGLSGRVNLLQAFSFYRYVSSICRIHQVIEPRILDFGGGWGRISRFFLRDTKPECIYIAETRKWAIECLHTTGNRSHVIHNQPRPPILGLIEQFDLVFAYSVFSHLSEEYFHAWINYLLSVLRPGGYLVFTTRGQIFINHLEHLHADKSKPHEMLEEHVRRLLQEMPLPPEIRRRYLKGDFQFYPIGGAGELTSDFFGEAFVPKPYIEQHFRPFFIDFSEEVQNVDQSVVVLQKPG
jgi:2-polyprenyl-3-methyl-5-hydroxy-6-metoxy-1,4-benzoquinol methylase